MLLGSIEAGGTKFVCGVGNENGEIIDHCSFPTTSPEETLQQVGEFFSRYTIDALGVGSFGPVDLDQTSSTYGYVTTTPKVKWTNFNLLGALKKMFNVPIGFDTDVNAAALGEAHLGAATGLDSCIYMTVGTGIGVGAVVEGKLLHGMSHPEMGHIFVRRHEFDFYKGTCPYHNDCLEGLAAGPGIEARWGKKGVELQEEAAVWELEAFYLSQALVNYALILSPKRMVLGGGVMKQKQLFPLIREQFAKRMNGYIQNDYINDLETYIVSPQLGDFAGLKGGILLAKEACENNKVGVN